MEYKISLGDNDAVLKTWFNLIPKGKISTIIRNAVIFYQLTGNYMTLGNIGRVDSGLPNTRKMVLLGEDEKTKGFFEDCKKVPVKPVKVIRRILKNGIKTEEGKNWCINADDTYECIERVITPRQDVYSVQPDKTETNLLQVPERIEPPILQTETSKDEKLEPDVESHTTMPQSSKARIEEPDFMLDLLAEGCGLGGH